MKIVYTLWATLALLFLFQLPVHAQVSEPDFIGEAFLLKSDSTTLQLDKEIGDFTKGVSWSSNSFNALSLEINGDKSQVRVSSNGTVQLVVRSVDNNSDPLTIISLYKFKAKGRKRTVVLSKDNSGTAMKSRTMSKDMLRFSGKRFGKSSYLISLNELKSGEYGIVVSNPNNRDEKKIVVSCFAVD